MFDQNHGQSIHINKSWWATGSQTGCVMSTSESSGTTWTSSNPPPQKAGFGVRLFSDLAGLVPRRGSAAAAAAKAGAHRAAGGFALGLQLRSLLLFAALELL